MNINFDVVIESDDYSVSMTEGLETLQGASALTRHIAETLLTERVPERLASKSNVRTKLKKSFRGSFGQMFSLEVYDEHLMKKFRKIGKSTFIELMGYFICEALYREHEQLSDKANSIIDKMGGLEEELVEKLRKSSLENFHSVSAHMGKEVKLRFRKNANENDTITKVDSASYQTLKPKIDKKKVDIIAGISRLNIHTGNGRLLIKGSAETVAFGFPSSYKEVKHEAKKKFSKNLDFNNGIHVDEWNYLTLRAHTLKLNNGRTIKYLIEGIYD